MFFTVRNKLLFVFAAEAISRGFIFPIVPLVITVSITIAVTERDATILQLIPTVTLSAARAPFVCTTEVVASESPMSAVATMMRIRIISKILSLKDAYRSHTGQRSSARLGLVTAPVTAPAPARYGSASSKPDRAGDRTAAPVPAPIAAPLSARSPVVSPQAAKLRDRPTSARTIRDEFSVTLPKLVIALSVARWHSIRAGSRASYDRPSLTRCRSCIDGRARRACRANEAATILKGPASHHRPRTSRTFTPETRAKLRAQPHRRKSRRRHMRLGAQRSRRVGPSVGHASVSALQLGGRRLARGAGRERPAS